MGIVIGAVAVVFVLALIIFPGVRGKLKVLVGGFLNIWHMGSFDCAVKGGDYGMGNAFETYPLAVMTHLADMEATYLVEGLVAK